MEHLKPFRLTIPVYENEYGGLQGMVIGKAAFTVIIYALLSADTKGELYGGKRKENCK